MSLWTNGNLIQLLDGDEYFRDLFQAISQAREEIYIETYILTEDEIGNEFIDKLLQARKRHVKVHLVVDGVGSSELSLDCIEKMQGAGIDLKIFRPYSKLHRLREIFLKRLHRKVAVIDKQIAFVGGINLSLNQSSKFTEGCLLDYAVSAKGPVVVHIQRSLESFFRRLTQGWKRFTSFYKKNLEFKISHAGNMRAAFIVRDNIFHRRAIENQYLDAIHSSDSEILIANAYFLPNFRIRHALRKAARRKVRVRLIVQGNAEFWFLKRATRALYRSFLKAGIEIYEYEKAVLHAKVAAVDKIWATVGSSNLEPFSLFMNLEANIVIEDSSFAENLTIRLENDLKTGAKKIHSKEFSSNTFQRLLDRMCFMLLQFLTGLARMLPQKRI